MPVLVYLLNQKLLANIYYTIQYLVLADNNDDKCVSQTTPVTPIAIVMAVNTLDSLPIFACIKVRFGVVSFRTSFSEALTSIVSACKCYILTVRSIPKICVKINKADVRPTKLRLIM